MDKKAFFVNDKEFSHLIANGGYDVTRNDIHSSDSGRNTLTGRMFFRIITTKYTIEIAIIPHASQDEVADLISEISKNGRINRYKAYIPHTKEIYEFTGYINPLKIGVFSFYYDLNNQLGANLKSFPINIIEV